jgi:hypothetical protein
MSYSTSSSNRVQQGSNLVGLLLGLYRTADFDNRDYIGTNYTSSGIATLEAIEAIERFRYHRNIYKPYYNNPLWTSDVQKPNTVNRYIAGIELTHSFTDKFKILTRANVDGTDEKNINVSDIFFLKWRRFFATEEGITHRQYNIDLMGIGNVNLLKI